jgi:hypothetical protein
MKLQKKESARRDRQLGKPSSAQTTSPLSTFALSTGLRASRCAVGKPGFILPREWPSEGFDEIPSCLAEKPARG